MKSAFVLFKQWLGCVLILSAIAVFTGCVGMRNGFSEFYQDRVGPNVNRLAPYSGSTRVVMMSNPQADIEEAFRNGFVALGAADFSSPAQPESYIKSQAEKVGADLVLYSSAFLGSQQTTVAVPQYNPGQTYTTYSSGTVNANAYGSGGYAYGSGNYYGSSTTTTPGTFSTQYVPVTVQRYEYHAVFFRKGLPPKFGTQVTSLPNEVRAKLGRNTGAFVATVINDSPAFRANIIEGDVILKLNSQDVISPAEFTDQLGALAGQSITIQVWRNGELKDISIQLNP